MIKPMTFPLKSKRDKEVALNVTVLVNVVLEFKIRNNKHMYWQEKKNHCL